MSFIHDVDEWNRRVSGNRDRWPASTTEKTEEKPAPTSENTGGGGAGPAPVREPEEKIDDKTS